MARNSLSLTFLGLRMPLSIACQMDPIDRIDIRGDSTFAMLLEAQRRGHKLHYYTPPHLSLLNGKLIAQAHTLKVEDKKIGRASCRERV